MEELILTDPVTEPETTKSSYRVIALYMNYEALSPTDINPGIVTIQLKDNLGGFFTHEYTGQIAIDYMKFINTANFSTTSMNKRILQRLSNEGVLSGTVTGAPDGTA